MHTRLILLKMQLPFSSTPKKTVVAIAFFLYRKCTVAISYVNILLLNVCDNILRCNFQSCVHSCCMGDSFGFFDDITCFNLILCMYLLCATVSKL